MQDFIKAVEKRRSVYTISQETVIPDEEITDIVKRLVVAVPSGYNSQSARVVILFGRNHTGFWNIVMETLRARVAPEKFAATEEKISGFLNGHGTLLFYDDAAVTLGLEAQFPRYREHFRSWADQANGMLQFAIWTALEDRGFGVNIQHYNPVIDDEVRAVFSIPENWRLIAQMPFGKPYAWPEPVEKIPADERVIIVRGDHPKEIPKDEVRQKEEAVKFAKDAMGKAGDV
jgi:predicted oxidoreductase (fatty acid repression mutant protein)